jgi:hypothetical protein
VALLGALIIILLPKTQRTAQAMVEPQR